MAFIHVTWRVLLIVGMAMIFFITWQTAVDSYETLPQLGPADSDMNRGRDVNTDLSLEPLLTNIVRPSREKCTLEERRIAYQKMCQVVKPAGNISGSISNYYFNIHYCRMPKAGSGTMWNIIDQLNSYEMAIKNRTDRKPASPKPIRLLVVRHPLAKLRSIYEGKLSHYHLNEHMLGRNVKLIDEYFSEAAIHRNGSFDPKSEFLTFEQFLDILARKYAKGFHDPHLTPLTQYCALCHVPYNTILKLDTFDEDLAILLEKLNAIHPETNITIRHDHNNNRNLTSAERDSKDNQLFASLNSSLVRRVLKVYENDMRLLGYQWSEEGGLTCGYTRPDGTTCC